MSDCGTASGEFVILVSPVWDGNGATFMSKVSGNSIRNPAFADEQNDESRFGLNNIMVHAGRQTESSISVCKAAIFDDSTNIRQSNKSYSDKIDK